MTHLKTLFINPSRLLLNDLIFKIHEEVYEISSYSSRNIEGESIIHNIVFKFIFVLQRLLVLAIDHMSMTERKNLPNHELSVLEQTVE